MKKRRYRAPSADSQGMTQEDLQAIRSYRSNRTSSRYYSDLKAIDQSAPSTPPTETKK